MAFKDFFPPQAPTVASNSAVVLKGLRERIIAELHRWEDCGFASSADDIADRIVEQPAARHPTPIPRCRKGCGRGSLLSCTDGRSLGVF